MQTWQKQHKSINKRSSGDSHRCDSRRPTLQWCHRGYHQVHVCLDVHWMWWSIYRNGGASFLATGSQCGDTGDPDLWIWLSAAECTWRVGFWGASRVHWWGGGSLFLFRVLLIINDNGLCFCGWRFGRRCHRGCAGRRRRTGGLGRHRRRGHVYSCHGSSQL